MSSTDCYLDGSGCLVCPEIKEVPAQPAVYQRQASHGWNAGANSVAQIGGDVHLTFDLEATPAGIMLGFKTARYPQDNPNLIQHGFYAYGQGGKPFLDIMESGQTRATVSYTLGQPIEIRRIGAQVLYLVDNTLVYQSKVSSYGAVLVNACLYASGDTVP